MPPRSFMLGFLVYSLANSWIFAVAGSYGNGTSNSSEVDETQRSGKPLPVDLQPVQEPTTNENKEKYHTEVTIERKFNQDPREELTGFEAEVPCDNAQFLLKIITVIMPLLRSEVPASTRTSYILYVLKDLLKSSPEAAQDHEIMYKINDLLMTLDKYHDRSFNERNTNALRQFNTAESSPINVQSKMVFKYELPQLENPDCTVELLNILKTVQKAILRLVRNPLCKSYVPEKLPLLIDLGQYSGNPSLKKLPSLPDANKPLLISEYPILDIDSSEIIVPDGGYRPDKKQFFPDFPNDKNKGQPNNYDKSPSQQKQRFHPIVPQENALYIYPEYPNEKNTIVSPYQYSIFPDILSIKNINKDTLKYATVSPKQTNIGSLIDNKFSKATLWPKNLKFPTIDQNNNIKLPNTQANKIFDVIGDGSREVQINNNPHMEYNLDFPSKQNKFLSRPPPSLDIYEDDDFSEIKIDPYKQKQSVEKPKQGDGFIDVFGLPKTAYISLNQYPQNFDVHNMFSKQNNDKNPQKYENSPQSFNTEPGVPNIPNNHQKQPYNQYIPSKSTYQVPKKHDRYNPYLLKPEYKLATKPFTPFHIANDGSGEIQINPNALPNLDYTDIDIITESPQTNPHFYPFEIEKIKYKNNFQPNILKPNDLYTSDEERLITSESESISNRPSRPDIENQYVFVDENKLFKEIPDTDNSLAYIDTPEYNEPKMWNPNNNPIKMLPQPQLVPDNKILLIIKDNIHMIEQKIPEENLNTEIREMIKKLKQLLNLKQITIEEYVSIINQYQILIEYFKNLNISRAIMKELLLSMTNLDKLNSPAGKSQVIELTYLIKRPKPLVYQPYYYIKYQIPYTSFLTQIERLLKVNPHFTRNPEKIHKDLISISKVAETSPDLEKYGKEDIIRLTFNKGTLVGAKVMKGTELSMYNTLDRLKNTNTDMTVEDVYELIKNLDSQLKHTSEGLVIENNNIPAFNTDSKSNKVRVMKVENVPVLQKISKITADKIEADNILKDILSKVHVLRSNISAHHANEVNSLPLESDTQKINDSTPLIGRSKDVYNMNKMYNSFSLPNEPSVYNIKSDFKNYLTEDDVKALKDPTYYVENNAVKLYGPNEKKSTDDLYWNNQMSNKMQYIKKTNSPRQSAWREKIINANHKRPTSYKSQSVDFDSNLIKANKIDSNLDPALIDSSISSIQQLHPITATKLLDSSLKFDNDYKRDNYGFQQYQLSSRPLEAPVSTSKIINNANKINSHLVQYYKTNIKRDPIEHSKFYLLEKTNDQEKEFKNPYTDPIQVNVEHSQSLTDYNSNTDYYNTNPTKFQPTSSVKNGEDYGFQQFQYNSRPLETSVSKSEIIKSPNNAKSLLVEHSETNINGIPVEQSKTSFDEKSSNEIQKSETLYADTIKYVKHSHTFDEYNPHATQYTIKTHPSQFQKITSEKNSNDYGFHQYQYDTGPLKQSVSINKIISTPIDVKSHIMEHSATYINGVPVEHSKSYLVEKPNKEVPQFETSYIDPMKYNVEHLQSLIDYEPRPFQEISNGKQKPNKNHVISQILSKGNSYSDYYNSANKPSEYQNMNLQQFQTNKLNHGKNLAQNQAYLGYPYIYNRNHLTSNVKQLGLHPRNLNFLPSNAFNIGHRYSIHQRLPIFHQLSRWSRPLTRPFQG